MSKKILILALCASLAAATSACKKKVMVACGDSPKKLNLLTEKSFRAVCGTYCSQASGSVWGSNPFTTDSSICRAAIHAGVMPDVTGGIVTVTLEPGMGSYAGTESNGITSSSWGAYDSSFTVK